MHSDLIGKIEKAKRYAQEPERFALEKITAHFRGGSSDHAITLEDDQSPVIVTSSRPGTPAAM